MGEDSGDMTLQLDSLNTPDPVKLGENKEPRISDKLVLQLQLAFLS